MEKLVDKVIRLLKVNDDQSVLVFDTDDGAIVYETEGDCCSETWFSDILNISNIINETVIAVRKLELPDVEDDRSRQEYDRVYGFALDTKKGSCEVIFRNSSNGYYGGSIDLRTLPIPEGMGLTTIGSDDWEA